MSFTPRANANAIFVMSFSGNAGNGNVMVRYASNGVEVENSASLAPVFAEFIAVGLAL